MRRSSAGRQCCPIGLRHAKLVVRGRQALVDRYELVGKVPTDKLTRTGFFDADRGLLYVVVPRLAGQDGPQLRVYRVKP
jgi:hypothetical protein